MSEPTPDVKSVFGKALELPSAADRAAYLDAACVEHPALRAEVDALLQALDRAGDFLNAPPSDATRSHPDPNRTGSLPPATEKPGTIIAGRYKLLQQIGEGGMGAVWMADQTEPVKRRVAVKLIRADHGASRTILSRFEAERQAIALMNHPNIAKLLDAGTTDDGSPFFVMELVKGVPLTDYCDAHKLSVQDRLNLFGQICSAVHHAHQKGVIHRDLKPTNILVESHDGKPVPKVIDFGLAKATTGMQLTEHTLFTGFGNVMGTPLYMAPEQATFNAIDVDSRADIYALGVILYELLAGSTPIHRDTLKTAALDEMLRVIREQEPPPPSSRIGTTASQPSVAANRQSEPVKLGRFVRGELDWIVMKALAKERDRRYESATAFAADVERFLAHEPVTAGPPSQWYRLRKFVRRNKGRVVAAALVLFVLVAGIAGTSLGLVVANRAKELARAEEEKALVALDEKGKALDEKGQALDAETRAKQAETAAKNQLADSLRAEQQAAYDVTIPLIQKAIQENDFARASALLASCPEKLRHWEWQFLNRQFDRGAVTVRPGYSELRFGREVDEFTADGKCLVSCTGAKVRVRDAATGDTKRDWDFGALGNTARLSPDRWLVAVWFQHKLAGFPQVEAPDAPDGPDAAGKPFDVSVVSLETGKPVARLTGLPDRVRAVLFSPDSSRLATACANNEVGVWDGAGKLLHTLKTDGATRTVAVAFTPDGKSLITNGVSGAAGIQLSANGTFKGGEGTFRVWNLDTGAAGVTGAIAPYAEWTNVFAKRAQILPNSKEPFARFSPDGRYAVGLASDVFKFAVDLTTGKEAFRLSDDFTGLGFLPNGSLLAVNPDGVCTAFELPGGKVVRSYPLPKLHKKTEYEFESPIRWATQLSADGRWLVLSDPLDGVVEVREAESGRVVRSVPTGRSRSGISARLTAINPTGTKLLTTSTNGEQKLWDLSTDTAARTINLASESRSIPRVLAASPDGRTVAVLVDTQRQKGEGWPARLELADLRTGTSRALKEGLAINTSGNAHAVFSPDGRKVMAMIEGTHTGLSQFHPHVWDVETGKLLVRSSVIGVSVNARSFDLGLPQIAFSPDGVPLVARTATSKDLPGQKAWLISEVVAERTTAPARVTIMTGEESALRLSADGRLAAVLGRSLDVPAVEMWDCETRQVLWSVPTEQGRVGKLDGFFSGDGSRLLLTDLTDRNRNSGQVTDAAPAVSVRDTRSGRVVSEFRLPAGTGVRGLSFSPDGRRVFAVITGGQTRSVIFNADTGRELVANFDNDTGLKQAGGRVAQRLLLTPDGHLLTAEKRPTADAKDAADLLVWDGRKSAGVAKPAGTIDDMLAEAFRLTEDPDPAKRNPARALELTRRLRDLYPTVPEAESPHGLALLRSKRFAEAAEVFTACVIREEIVERSWTYRKLDDGSKEKKPQMAARKATDYFLLALATAGTGDGERAKLWFTWGEARLLSPYTWGERRAVPRPGETSSETERARAEPFRQEAARVLGLPALPITQADLRKLKHDPAHPINRLEWMLGRMRAGDKYAESDATAFWAAEFLVTHSEPIPELFYNAACVYSLASGKATVKKEEYAGRAMELLYRATKSGAFQQPDMAKMDKDLDPLRYRGDFKQWLTELEKATPRVLEHAPAPRVKK